MLRRYNVHGLLSHGGEYPAYQVRMIMNSLSRSSFDQGPDSLNQSYRLGTRNQS